MWAAGVACCCCCLLLQVLAAVCTLLMGCTTTTTTCRYNPVSGTVTSCFVATALSVLLCGVAHEVVLPAAMQLCMCCAWQAHMYVPTCLNKKDVTACLLFSPCPPARLPACVPACLPAGQVQRWWLGLCLPLPADHHLLVQAAALHQQACAGPQADPGDPGVNGGQGSLTDWQQPVAGLL